MVNETEVIRAHKREKELTEVIKNLTDSSCFKYL